MVCCDLLKYSGIRSLADTSLLLTGRLTCHSYGLLIANTYTHSVILSYTLQSDNQRRRFSSLIYTPLQTELKSLSSSFDYQTDNVGAAVENLALHLDGHEVAGAFPVSAGCGAYAEHLQHFLFGDTALLRGVDHYGQKLRLVLFNHIGCEGLEVFDCQSEGQTGDFTLYAGHDIIHVIIGFRRGVRNCGVGGVMRRSSMRRKLYFSEKT